MGIRIYTYTTKTMETIKNEGSLSWIISVRMVWFNMEEFSHSFSEISILGEIRLLNRIPTIYLSNRTRNPISTYITPNSQLHRATIRSITCLLILRTTWTITKNRNTFDAIQFNECNYSVTSISKLRVFFPYSIPHRQQIIFQLSN